MTQQLTIDFARAEQLDLLSRARLESSYAGDRPETNRVRAATLRLLLRTIDDFGRGGVAWPSIETIAQRSSISVRQVKRGLAVLKSLSVLCIEKRRNKWGVVTNHYTIVWSELALLASDKPLPVKADPAPVRAPAKVFDSPERGVISEKRGATLSDRGATLSDRGATLSKRGATLTPKSSETFINDLTAHCVNGGGGSESLISENAIVTTLVAEGVRCYRRVLADAKATGMSFAELVAVIDQYRRNKSKFSSPGVILERIRSGGWPVEIETVEQAKAKSESSDAKKRQAKIDSIRYRIISAGRTAKASDEAITAKLRAALDHFGFHGEPEWA